MKFNRKYIYQVDDIETFKNRILLNKNSVINTNFNDFCNEYGISTYNFFDNLNGNYKLTTDNVDYKVIDLDDKGMFFKYFINLSDIDIYNVKVLGSKICFAEVNNNATNQIINLYENIKGENNDEIFEFHDLHDFKCINRNQLLCLNDFLKNYNLEHTIDIKNNIVKTNAVNLTDFHMFYKINKLPCKVCNKLVNNAFGEYGINYDKHGECNV